MAISIEMKAYKATVGLVTAGVTFKTSMIELLATGKETKGKATGEHVDAYCAKVAAYASKVGGVSAKEIKIIRARFSTLPADADGRNWTLYFTTDTKGKFKTVSGCTLERVRTKRVDGGVRKTSETGSKTKPATRKPLPKNSDPRLILHDFADHFADAADAKDGQLAHKAFNQLVEQALLYAKQAGCPITERDASRKIGGAK